MWDLLSYGDSGWGDELARGALHTLGLAVTAAPIGIVLGLALGFAKDSAELPYRVLGRGISTIFRGMPELLTLLIVFVFGQRLMNIAGNWAGLHPPPEISVFSCGVIALCVVFAAYASEIFLGSLRAIQGSQLEAAAALGLGPCVTLRFVTFPELFRLSAPALSNQWLSLLKQTSLISVIGYDDFLHSGYVAAASTSRQLFFYVVICAGYLLMCSLTMPLFQWLMSVLSMQRGRPS